MASKPQVEKKYDAIIIDPDLDSRMRLKQACSSMYNFGKVFQLNSLEEAIGKAKGSDIIDVIFISYRFEEAKVSAFIKQAKETKGAQDAAFILVLKTKDQDTSTVAKNVMVGADGFLFEPYSVDYLLEITRLSSKVKAERSVNRERAAINMVIQDVIGAIDQLSYIRQCKVDPGSSLKRLRELCNVFNTLDEEKIKVYYEAAIKCFEEAPMPTNVFQTKRYGGVSNRIKRKMEEKILAEVQAREEEKKT